MSSLRVYEELLHVEFTASEFSVDTLRVSLSLECWGRKWNLVFPRHFRDFTQPSDRSEVLIFLFMALSCLGLMLGDLE